MIKHDQSHQETFGSPSMLATSFHSPPEDSWPHPFSDFLKKSWQSCPAFMLAGGFLTSLSLSLRRSRAIHPSHTLKRKHLSTLATTASNVPALHQMPVNNEHDTTWYCYLSRRLGISFLTKFLLLQLRLLRIPFIIPYLISQILKPGTEEKVSINQSINQSIYLSINQSINLSTNHSFIHSFIHSFVQIPQQDVCPKDRITAKPWSKPSAVLLPRTTVVSRRTACHRHPHEDAQFWLITWCKSPTSHLGQDHHHSILSIFRQWRSGSESMLQGKVSQNPEVLAYHATWFNLR